MAKGHRWSTKGTTRTPNVTRDGALKANDLCPGSTGLVDHFESRLKGRTFDSFGKATSDQYMGGYIFIDHAGISPNDIFLGTRVPRYKLRNTHVWGCPVYVLNPSLQAGKKIPRRQNIYFLLVIYYKFSLHTVVAQQMGTIQINSSRFRHGNDHCLRKKKRDHLIFGISVTCDFFFQFFFIKVYSLLYVFFSLDGINNFLLKIFFWLNVRYSTCTVHCMFCSIHSFAYNSKV